MRKTAKSGLMAPRIDERIGGVPYRYAAYGVDDPVYPIAHNVAELGVNHNFVARTPNAAEGDGDLLAVVQRLSERRSELIVLNAIHNAWLDRVPAKLRG
jgi:hypothetical protein